MTLEIKINDNLDSDMARKIATRLFENKDTPHLSLNLENTGFVYPFSSLLLLSAIWTTIDYREENGLESIEIIYNSKNPACTYLGYFGFFREIGIDFGRENDGEIRKNFIPIITIKLKSLKKEASEQGLAIQEIIQRKSEEIVKIILPNDRYDNEEDQLLAFSLREIIRNCFEHGEARACYVMGQRWKNGYAELAILDRGIGIQSALSKKFAISKTKHALEMAISPGISSGNIDSDDYYANSGFGLYITSELCKRYGKFALCSSEGMLNISKSAKPTYVTTPPVGTIVRLRMKIDNGEYFPNVRQLIINTGEEIAGIAAGEPRKASKASKN